MHVESFMMYIVGHLNGIRCRDGVKVLWCHSHLVWLFFLGFHIYMCFRKLFVTCSCCFGGFCVCFVLLFWNGKREVGGEVKGKMHGL